MKKILFLITICIGGMALMANSVDDSTGVILRNNQVYILHKVDAGQGLFAVGRRYKIHWTAIRDANPGSETSLYPGKILYVPTGKTESQFWGKKKPIYSKDNSTYNKPKEKVKPEKEKKSIADETSNSPKTSFTVFYTVKKGETLFSIAEKFNTTVEFLKQLNNLKTEKVKEGTDILVPFAEETKEKVTEKTESKPKETITEKTEEETKKDNENESNSNKNNDKESKENAEKDKDEILIEKKEETKKVEKEIEDISKKIEEEKNNEKKENDKSNDTEDIENIIKEADKNKEKETKKDEVPSEESVNIPWKYKIEVESFPEYDIEKVSEKGQGKVMDDKTIDQTKDWVIHHNAPENTIILITNPINNKTVYAKVVKNFNRKDDNQVIVYITKNTADFLELSKKDKFNIKLSFAK
ncbi:MAG: LysM peptidoglycan-binding domain-containing protein [Bacteroidetes bacterium]|nr:LysM peptidoglycan-binding domain-containing protein [Bacteroidota bacterium]